MSSEQHENPATAVDEPGSIQLTQIRRKPVPTLTTSYPDTTNESGPDSQQDIERCESLSSRKIKPMLVAVDVLLCLTPIPFLVLAGIAFSLDGRQLSHFGSGIERWSLLSPTIFPLVFSAVIGRALSFLARYKLERGTSLGVMEQLMGSQTVFGAIWIHWVLRSVNLLGIVLVSLWLLSPLGGQASLRLLSRVDDVRQGASNFAYVNMSVPTDQSAVGRSLNIKSQTDAMYKACLVAPLSMKNGSQDTWGNIKLPNFGAYNNSVDESGYANIPEKDLDWVALMGLPVAGPRSSINSTFDMTFQYHDVSCSPMYKRRANSSWVKEIDNTTSLNASSFWGSSDNLQTWRLWAIQKPVSEYATSLNTREFFWVSKSGLQRTVEPQSNVLNYNETCIARCSVSAHNVDAQVECSGKTCHVAKLRKSREYDTESQLTTLSSYSWNDFTNKWIGTDLQSAAPSSSVTEQYIYGRIEAPFGYGATSDGLVVEYLDMTKVPLADFTRRFRTLLNTYYIASLVPSVSTGILANANATNVLNKTETFTGGSFPLTFVSTQANINSSTIIYRCNKAFFALSIISTMILLVLGVVGTLAKYRCRGPDMFGYVTSMARHNPYTPLPALQGVRDTDELARLVKNVNLRLEDVRNGTGEIGHIAVSSLQMRSIRLAWQETPERRYE